MKTKILLLVILWFVSASVCEVWGQDVDKAMIYFKNEEYYKAAAEFEAALPALEKQYGKNDTVWYAYYINYTALSFENCQQFSKAEQYYLLAKNIYENVSGSADSFYGAILNNLALLYSYMGQYYKALPLSIKALENCEKSLGKKHPSYSSRLNNLALSYSDMGEYDKALPLLLEALENTKENLGKNNFEYGMSLGNLGALYSEMGEYEKALPFLLQALENIEETLGKEHPEYGEKLNNLALFYANIGLYEKALFFYLQALENSEKYYGKAHTKFVIRLNNIAGLYRDIGNYDNALRLFLEALDIMENLHGKEHPLYGALLYNLSDLYKQMGQYEQAMFFCLEALKIHEILFNKEHRFYGECLNLLAVLYSIMNEYDKALPIYQVALEIVKNTFGIDNLKYAITFNSIANLYVNTGQFEQGLFIYKETQNIFLNKIESNFTFLSETEKEKYVKTVLYNFEVYQSFYSKCHAQQSGVEEYSYNIELAIKGMILNSGINMRQAILNSNNPEALAKYDDWLNLRVTLVHQYTKPLAERTIDVAIYEAEVDKLEGELARLSSGFEQNKKLFSIKWEDVQKQLKPNEVAIEFASFRYYNDKEWTDSTMYIALVLRPQDTHPQLVPLCEQKQLDSLFANKGSADASFVASLYRGATALQLEDVSLSANIYTVLWEPLAPYIPEGSTVYFAPSGTLHQIAFAAIQTPDGKVLSDKYRLVQLSTTARLAQESAFKETNITDIALFGGIYYDVEEKDLLAQSLLASTKNTTTRALPHDLERGSQSWNFLQGTLNEVNAINNLAQSNKIKTQLYTGVTAVEERFKALSGNNSPRILHIATHGFFFPDPQKEYKETGFMGQEDKHVFRASDNPLNRAGLLFAGANRTWKGDTVPEGVDDGILTAYEAANVYLNNTQLVVLSACETGLGDIKGSEGVFGLQRAFKGAGAEYLLMSLWKVPDNETAEFMAYFYGKLFTGSSILVAFESTQTYMKTKYTGEPYKWAAFVLIR